MKRYLCAVAVLFCTNAFANETPFETLKREYENAKAAASLDDFDQYGAKDSNQVCAIAREDYDRPDIAVMKIHTVVIPAVPSRGPLFPGEPEKKKSGLIIYYYNFNDLEEVLDGIVQSETLKLSENELVINISQVDGYKDSPFEFRIKKNKTTIHFSMKTNFKSELETLFYGYCWRG